MSWRGEYLKFVITAGTAKHFRIIILSDRISFQAVTIPSHTTCLRVETFYLTSLYNSLYRVVYDKTWRFNVSPERFRHQLPKMLRQIVPLKWPFSNTERKRTVFLWSLSLLNVNIKLVSLWTHLEAMSLAPIKFLRHYVCKWIKTELHLKYGSLFGTRKERSSGDGPGSSLGAMWMFCIISVPVAVPVCVIHHQRW